MRCGTRTTILAIAVAGGFQVASFSGERIPLWPEGKIPDFSAEQIGATIEEANAPGFSPEEHRMPYLEWFPDPPVGAPKTDACIIVISGGAYEACVDGKAFRPLVEKMLMGGVRCVNLTYRTPRPKGREIFRSGWEDGQRAVRIVRSQAAARGIDPEKIGVMGCSAGAHLAMLLGTSACSPSYAAVDELDEVSCHVNWAILNCPAYALTDGLSGKNATGGNGPGVKISPKFRFDAKTCPMLFFHGGRDHHSPVGSTMAYRKLRTMGIPAELHLDADRGHGPVGVASYERAMEFMRQGGWLGELEKPRVRDYAAGGMAGRRMLRDPLWPKGRIPELSSEPKDGPCLTWYIPRKTALKSVALVFSGDGYVSCADAREGLQAVDYLNQKGMAAVVLTYRCPRPKHGRPKHLHAWQDVQRAIRVVRVEAPKHGLDPERIGVIGFSAGGHLALLAAACSRTAAYSPIDRIDDVSCKVSWACPVGSAYVLTDGVDGPNVHGGNLDEDVIVPELSFDGDVPPMCFVHGDADEYASMNSVKVWEKLRRLGIQCDLHTFAWRGHGFQLCCSPGTGSWTWMDRIWDFLTKKGFNR